MALLLNRISLSKSKHPYYRHRRKFIESWNEETKKKFVDLKNKTADVKDFSKFKQSDVENITVLNTLINAWITKLYDSTKFQDDVKREDTYDQQNLTNSKDHSNKIYENPVSKVKSARFSGDDWVYHLKVCDPKSFENKSNLKINDYKMMAESEQGSMMDFNKIADKHNYQNEYLSSYQRRSILKLKKTVWFNLHRNQTRIIVA